MAFAYPLPWWALAVIVVLAALLAWATYRRFAAGPRRRALLGTLRFVTLLLLVLFLMRPVTHRPDDEAMDAVVVVLVDISRSMSIEDAGPRGNLRRIDYARELLTARLLPLLAGRFDVEVLGFGEGVAPVEPGQLVAAARRSDLSAALDDVRERYRGRPVAGIVLLSDGGDTSGDVEAVVWAPVHPIGIGSRTPWRDREVLSVTAAEAVLDDSRVELAVSAVGHGYGTAPIELRLLENGRPVQVRRAAPRADGAPVHEVFHVTPPRGAAAVYTVEIPSEPTELVPENNVRSVLVQPPARSRRVLLIQGAPGFEHSFLKRAWASDTGLEVDSVVRKGKDDQGQDTFYIQAARGRVESLTRGYPRTPEQLFAYDAIVLANVEADQLTRAQLETTRDFVSRRGGGLLVLGGLSFARHGLLDTPLEDVLPLDLADRGGASLASFTPRGLHRVTLTEAGASHPVMQLAPSADDSRQRWERAPALASIASLGGPRPGATVLALTSGPGGAPRALVAVQRFGEGRSLVFTGEAAWRWRMFLPSGDRSYDTFWRQAARWIALPAQDPVSTVVPAGAAAGEMVTLRVLARNARFEPQRDATVDVRVTGPDGRLETLAAAVERDGSFVARFRPDQPGVYRVSSAARRGATPLGSSTASLLVGGADLEMTDPRLNLRLLQRLAVASGGAFLADGDLGGLPGTLRAAVPAARLAVRRDLWHNGWAFGLIVALLAAEWILRRRWGLR